MLRESEWRDAGWLIWLMPAILLHEECLGLLTAGCFPLEFPQTYVIIVYSFPLSGISLLHYQSEALAENVP